MFYNFFLSLKVIIIKKVKFVVCTGIIFSVSICTVSCLGQWHNNKNAFMDMATRLRSTGNSQLSGDPQVIVPTSWSRISPYVLVTFLLLSSSTLYNYLNAMFGGPGCVAKDWAPVSLITSIHTI